MYSSLTRPHLEEALQAHRLAYGVLELQNGVTALITRRGGRVLGPFLRPGEGSLFWINPVWGDRAAFADFLEQGHWNLGGERLWLSPETQWLVSDRNDFWGTLRVPSAFDPGAWELDPLPEGGWRLRESIRLTAYNLARGDKELSIERRFRAVPDPLRYSGYADELLDGVLYAGYEQAVTLSESAHDDITAQIWTLIQLHAGGQIVVPCSRHVTLTDYNEPIDDAHRTVEEHCVRFRITGTRRYKVGLRAAHTFGRLGYLNRDGERAYLLVRNYFNNPSSLYSEEPAHLPGARGDSIHIYNDGGMFGGFGELEVQGQTVGGETELSTVRDQHIVWIYEGPAAQIGRIAEHLLGTDPSA